MPTLTGLRARVAEAIPEPLFYRLISWLHYAGEPELRVLRSFVPADRLALDVGGWYGPWTYWLARIARRVVTIEPVPEVAQFLRRVAPSNVQVSCLALSDHSGEGELFVPTGGRGSEGLSSLIPPPADGPDRRRILVPLCRVDDLALDRLGFVKIDVEGHELEVLSGARETLARHRPNVVVEVEQRFHEEPIDVVFDALTSLDYEGSFYRGGAWVPLRCFDIAEHQIQPLERLREGGFIAHSLMGHRGYVNNFLFTPRQGGRVP